MGRACRIVASGAGVWEGPPGFQEKAGTESKVCRKHTSEACIDAEYGGECARIPELVFPVQKPEEVKIPHSLQYLATEIVQTDRSSHPAATLKIHKSSLENPLSPGKPPR
jgi:hypothetical protein